MKDPFKNLENRINKLYDENSENIFDNIIKMSSSAFTKESPLYKYKDTDILENLIEHFKSTEEYEKCAVLLKISWRLKGVI